MTTIMGVLESNQRPRINLSLPIMASKAITATITIKVAVPVLNQRQQTNPAGDLITDSLN